MRFVYVLLALVIMTSLRGSSGRCVNGVDGVGATNVCCENQCETCGGPGCNNRPGGTNSCCAQAIRSSGVMCSSSLVAPCIVDGLCTNGVAGVESSVGDETFCCEARCGTCGGSGCGSRPGGEDGCCHSNIRASGRLCSATFAAPCIN